jgi:solute carrier family 66, member 2
MIGIQIILLHVALINRPPPNSHVPFHGTSTQSRPYNFWQWSKPRPYWLFLAYFTITLLVGHVFFGPIAAYTTLLGYLALAVEAVLPVPQLMANYKRRGCKGFRLSVIINWLIGDAFKMWFFFASGSGEGGVPWAFKLCGIFQACCDLGLGAQFWYFGDGPEEVGRGQAHPADVLAEKMEGIEMNARTEGWPKNWEK